MRDNCSCRIASPNERAIRKHENAARSDLPERCIVFRNDDLDRLEA